MKLENELRTDLSNEIKRIMQLDKNKENYLKFQDALSNIKSEKCTVKYGWRAGEHIGFDLIFDKGKKGEPFETFINGIENVCEAYYFILGLYPDTFQYNPTYNFIDEKINCLRFKLMRNE